MADRGDGAGWITPEDTPEDTIYFKEFYVRINGQPQRLGANMLCRYVDNVPPTGRKTHLTDEQIIECCKTAWNDMKAHGVFTVDNYLLDKMKPHELIALHYVTEARWQCRASWRELGLCKYCLSTSCPMELDHGDGAAQDSHVQAVAPAAAATSAGVAPAVAATSAGVAPAAGAGAGAVAGAVLDPMSGKRAQLSESSLPCAVEATSGAAESAPQMPAGFGYVIPAGHPQTPSGETFACSEAATAATEDEEDDDEEDDDASIVGSAWYVKCTFPTCCRDRQYEEGCAWSRCCKACFATDGRRHDDWCNDKHQRFLLRELSKLPAGWALRSSLTSHQ